MINTISILGSTGSIGTQAIEVAQNLGIKITALAVNNNISLLKQQIDQLNPEIVAVYDEEKAYELKSKMPNTNIKIVSGMNGLCEVAAESNSDMMLNSVVGMVGLKPTLEAINAKRNIALANKETLVAGGQLVMEQARANDVNVYPVDSEHSAIFQCLQGCNSQSEISKLILTASGGPFFGKKYNELLSVTKEQALRHPNWDMGAKVTIDSATMMNKGLELIEAYWLFDVNPEDIEIIVHRESIIHSMVEYKDGSVVAQLGTPDMRIPIQYALSYPERKQSLTEKLDLVKVGKLSFHEPDYETFLCLKACKLALDKGGLTPAVANAVNEEAVKLFLNDQISFLDIGRLVMSAVEEYHPSDYISLEDVLETDKLARENCINYVSNSKKIEPLED